MKKYITVAALLAAGTAFANAATLATIDQTNDTLTAYWNFDTDSNPVVSDSVWTGLPTWNVGKYGVCGENTNPETSAAGLVIASGLTISFDVKDITKAGSLFTMSSGGNEGLSQAWRAFGVSVTEAGTIEAYCLAATGTKVSGKLADVSDDGVISAGTWNTVTLVGSKANNSDNFDFSLYINGVLLGAQSVGATNFTKETANKAAFGYYEDSAKSAAMSIDNILVYNRAFTADEVAALQVVPEPSAFGLLAGIGALALVASRRRRK